MSDYFSSNKAVHTYKALHHGALNYGIIGSGAIGLYLAQVLEESEAPLKVSMFGRSDAKTHELIVKERLEQKDFEQKQYEQNTSSKQQTKALAKRGHYHLKHHNLQSVIENKDPQIRLSDLDLLIIPVKYYQLAALVAQLQGKLPEQLPLLLLQNGLGGHEILHEKFPNNTLYVGTTSDAVFKQGHANKSTITINARGKLSIGAVELANAEPESKAPAVIQALIDAHRHAAKPRDSKVPPSSAVWAQDIRTHLYQKLAANAVINPLSAKLNCRNGEIKGAAELLEGIKSEIFKLYKALEVGLDEHLLNRYIDDVIHNTAQNYSSMQQDIYHKRKTEIDGILGVLIEKAAKLNMSLPLIERIYQQIKDMESQYLGTDSAE
uniref:ketopantoate reductase family protein n=1 Tax=Ningiella ruwaisensis TaxID=2364274 RepID=UPI00109F6692|nr:2-dehydropantoate 2-reductase [Ningiella ruwaisensis]